MHSRWAEEEAATNVMNCRMRDVSPQLGRTIGRSRQFSGAAPGILRPSEGLCDAFSPVL